MRSRRSILLPLLFGGLFLPLALPGCSDNDADACADGTDTSCQPGADDDAGVDASDDGSSPSADAGHDASSDADAPDGGGEKPGSASATIGAEGGTIEVLGLTLDVPGGALQKETLLTVTRTALPAPGSGYTPLYRFDPEGLVFDLPVSASFWLPADFLSKPLTTFWSKLDEPSIYEDIGGEIGPEAIVAKTSHFSTAYVGLSEGEKPGDGCSTSGTFGWALENPLPLDVNFRRVAALSANDIYVAISHSTSLPLPSTLAQRWNGSAFESVGLPANAVWAAGTSDVFLATPTGVARGSGTSFVHKDVGSAFNDVHGNGPDDVWAVGENGKVQRWDGSTWTAFDIGTTEPLSTVWVGSATNVWIGIRSSVMADRSENYAFHFDGTSWRTWTKAELGFSAYSMTGPRKIWGSSGNDVYFCGSTFVHHYDGTTMTRVFETALPGGCSDMSGRSPNDIYFAEGLAEGGYTALPSTRVVHFNGTNITDFATPEGVTYAVDATVPGLVAIAGQAGIFGVHEGGTLEMHSSGFADSLENVWVAPTGEAYAFGKHGIYAGDCGQWRLIDSDASRRGIDGLSASEVWIGAVGGVRRVQGTRFEIGPIEPFGIGDPDRSTHRVHVAAANSVFASGTAVVAGNSRTWVYRWDGASWTDISPTDFSDSANNKVVSVSADEAFLGSGHDILRWRAGAWTTEATGMSQPIQDLVSLGDGEILAMNRSGIENSRIRGTDGTWRSAAFPNTAAPFESVWARAANDVYAVCAFGNCQGSSLWHWDGSTWSSPAQVGQLIHIHGNIAGDVVAVGTDGRIWRRARR